MRFGTRHNSAQFRNGCGKQASLTTPALMRIGLEDYWIVVTWMGSSVRAVSVCCTNSVRTCSSRNPNQRPILRNPNAPRIMAGGSMRPTLASPDVRCLPVATSIRHATKIGPPKMVIPASQRRTKILVQGDRSKCASIRLPPDSS